MREIREERERGRKVSGSHPSACERESTRAQWQFKWKRILNNTLSSGEGVFSVGSRISYIVNVHQLSQNELISA
jgi:hypothetical protein